MNFKTTIPVICASLLIACNGAPAVADEVTITTFYPSPNAAYKEFTASGKSTFATDEESFVGLGTFEPKAEVDLRHADPDASTGGPTVVNLSADDGNQVRLNLFTLSTPSDKAADDPGESAWQIHTAGDNEGSGRENRMYFDFHPGSGLTNQGRTLALDPSGTVAVNPAASDFSSIHQLQINGSLAVGDSASDFGSLLMRTDAATVNNPTQPYSAVTAIGSADTPNNGVARHLIHFRNHDLSAGSTRAAVANLEVDGSVKVVEDIQLQSTGHSLKQTGFVTGTYTGTGANQTIVLGFQPRMLQIWGFVQESPDSTAANPVFVSSSFEKTPDMPGGAAVFTFSENNHVGNPVNSTRNENTFGRTFTFFFDAGITLNADGFSVTGSGNLASGYFEASGVDPDGNGIKYYFTARR